jgi:hypothetical protein
VRAKWTMYGRKKKFIPNLVGRLQGKREFCKLCTNGWIQFKWILEKLGVRVWAGFTFLRIRANGRHLWNGDPALYITSVTLVSALQEVSVSKFCVGILLPPSKNHVRPSQVAYRYQVNDIYRKVPRYASTPICCCLIPLGPNVFLNTLFPTTCNLCTSLKETTFYTRKNNRYSGNTCK